MSWAGAPARAWQRIYLGFDNAPTETVINPYSALVLETKSTQSLSR